jgi:hypothetical protein
VPLPTLIDVAGLSDEGDDKMEELLRLLFYGHIKVRAGVDQSVVRRATKPSINVPAVCCICAVSMNIHAFSDTVLSLGFL